MRMLYRGNDIDKNGQVGIISAFTSRTADFRAPAAPPGITILTTKSSGFQGKRWSGLSKEKNPGRYLMEENSVSERRERIPFF
jgi:hypothetical protein